MRLWPSLILAVLGIYQENKARGGSSNLTKLLSIYNHTMRSFILLVCTLLLAVSVQAQSAKLRRAQKLMDRGDYQGAISLYVSVLDRGDDAEAKKNIAECYRKIGNSHEMEYWYGQVVLMPNADPKAMLYLAQAKQRNGKYKDAEKWVNQYLKDYPDDLRAQMILKASNEETVRNLRALGALYKVQACEELNTDKDEFCAVRTGKESNTLVFTSARDKGTARYMTDARTGEAFTELYTTTIQNPQDPDFNYRYEKPKKFVGKLNHKYHDGPASFSADGSKLFLTRNSMDGKSEDGFIRLKIYEADGGGKSWDTPKSLPFNDNEYSVAHPSIAADGSALYFASNMPGGYGGMDLYVSYYLNGRWEPPVNLGPSINTEGNEVFPFIHEDGTLYFSSDGHTGLGGLDIYLAKESYGQWSDPTNLGFPVNSVSDDFGISLNERKTHGYFASNREGGKGGDDIYSFSKLSIEVEVLVVDKNSQTALEAAEVISSCTDAKSFTTNSEGKVIIEIPVTAGCDFAAEKTLYKPNSVRKNTEELKAGDKLFVQIPLEIERIFDLSGRVIDGFTKEPVEGALVRLKSDCDGLKDEQQTLTDRDGRYEFLEIQENCDFQVLVRKSGYTENSASFATRKLEEGESLIEYNLVINCDDQRNPNCSQPGEIDPLDTNFIDDPYKPLPPSGDPSYDKDEFGAKSRKDLDSTQLANGDLKITNRKTGNQKIIKNNQTVIILSPDGDTLAVIPPVGKPELVHIFYDFDDARIREDAQPGLDALVEFMNTYPQARVSITSHTDARGSTRYNKVLSERRAQSAVSYLLQNGISKKRLKAKGMGKELMLNDCYDDVPCSEEQHQENRRTEFIVSDYDESGTRTESRKPSYIKVNPKPSN